MTVPKGDSEPVFFSETLIEGKGENRTRCFSRSQSCSCFVTPPNSKLEQTVKTIICLTPAHPARPDHVRVECEDKVSESRANFDVSHVIHFELGGYNNAFFCISRSAKEASAQNVSVFQISEKDHFRSSKYI